MNVIPGAYCSPPGARGITVKGLLVACKRDGGGGERYRWSP